MRVWHWALDAVKLARGHIVVRLLDHVLASEMDMVALPFLPRLSLQSFAVLLVEELLSVQLEVSNLGSHFLLLLLPTWNSSVLNHSVWLRAHDVAIRLLYLLGLFVVDEFVDVVDALVVVLAVQLLVVAVDPGQELVLFLLVSLVLSLRVQRHVLVAQALLPGHASLRFYSGIHRVILVLDLMRLLDPVLAPVGLHRMILFFVALLAFDVR